MENIERFLHGCVEDLYSFIRKELARAHVKLKIKTFDAAYWPVGAHVIYYPYGGLIENEIRLISDYAYVTQEGSSISVSFYIFTVFNTPKKRKRILASLAKYTGAQIDAHLMEEINHRHIPILMKRSLVGKKVETSFDSPYRKFAEIDTSIMRGETGLRIDFSFDIA